MVLRLFVSLWEIARLYWCSPRPLRCPGDELRPWSDSSGELKHYRHLGDILGLLNGLWRVVALVASLLLVRWLVASL